MTLGEAFPLLDLSLPIYEVRPREAGTADTEVSCSGDSQPWVPEPLMLSEAGTVIQLLIQSSLVGPRAAAETWC